MSEANESHPSPADLKIGPDTLALLEKLCNASGVSGDEGEVRSILLKEVRPLVDEVTVDPLGSVVAVRHARTHADQPLRVMLDAHMDEVGLLIVNDEDGGLYRFVKVGGIDDRALPGKPVLVGRSHTPGVIGAKAIHLTEPGETDNKIPVDSLRIDLGPGGRAQPGDWAVFATRFAQYGPSMVCKAFDNRVGCATIIEILRQARASGALDHLELLVSFSVQEEIGLRGARAAAYRLDPEIAIALDSTPATDLPPYDLEEDGFVEDAGYNVRLDHGPAIYLADAGTLAHPGLAQFLLRTAEENAIPFQIRQAGGGGTDAGAIHKSRAGVASISVSVPARYLHTAASLARVADWENTLRLVWTALSRMDRSILL